MKTSKGRLDLVEKSENKRVLLSEMFKTSQFFEILHFFNNFFSHTNITDSSNIANVKQNAEGCQNSIEKFPGSKHTQIFEKNLTAKIWSIRSNLFIFQNIILLLQLHGGRDYFKTLLLLLIL